MGSFVAQNDLLNGLKKDFWLLKVNMVPEQRFEFDMPGLEQRFSTDSIIKT